MPRTGSKLNAANDSIAADAIERDFIEAIHEFRQALAIDASYIEAQNGAVAGRATQIARRSATG